MLSWVIKINSGLL